MAEKLTPQQQQAVVNRGGKLLVSAAAGSGKTKVLVDRLLGYLTDPVRPANLDEFLIITYTKAAAAELRGKIGAKLSERIAREPDNRHLQHQMQRLFLTKISTVHGFCTDVLREYAYRLDLAADFRVADENEARELRETVLSDLLERAYEISAEDPYFRAFADTQGLGRDDRLLTDIILKVYDSARCHLDPEGWLRHCIDDVAAVGLSDAGETVWGRFLMEDLFSCLDGQIRTLETCVRLAGESRGMEKAAANLKDTLYQLQQLRSAETWDEIVVRKDIDYGRLSFPRKDFDAELAERIKACRNACKKTLDKKLRAFSDDSRQILEDLQQSADAARGLVTLVRQFDEAYAKAKKMRRCVDFSDLEHKMLDLLWGKSRSGITAAAGEIGSRFREIMVDEYQDSNGVQDAIFDALTRKQKNCFMVGDVKQSIYQFRLADPGIFLEKYHAYRDAEEARSGEGRKVLLSANFRSGGEVIEAVNDVFLDCMSEAVGGLRYGENEMLREGIPHEKLPTPAVELYGVEVEHTYEDEPAFVAQRIAELLDGAHMVRNGDGFRPIREEDIVILLRSPGSVGRYYQQALENRGIRCTSGGGTDLLRTEEIATLWNLLQTVANPRQDIPLIGTLASPVFGFGADDLAAMRSRQKQGCVYDALQADQSEKADDFLRVLDDLREVSRMCSVTELIERIYTRTRMDSIYAAMDGGDVRSANLQAFYDLAADYEATSRRELGQFLEYLQMMSVKGLMTTGENVSGAVTIMSIHKSKGLEFPVVFLCGLSREFNRESLRAQVLCDQKLGLGLSVADTKNRIRYPAISKRAIAAKMLAESLSEEMRVLYVAMTRARDRLVMTYGAQNLQKQLQELAMRLDLEGMEQLTRDAVCPGKWILLSALRRTEAGHFHNLAGRPGETHSSIHPWLIRVVAPPQRQEQGAVEEAARQVMPDHAEQKLRAALEFVYPHMEATVSPSKQTATQIKGRRKDQEAAEEAHVPNMPQRCWKKPSFRDKGRRGTAYGSAMHTLLQYLSFDACTGTSGIESEVQRLVSRKLLTAEQAEMIDCSAIANLFETEIGQKLRSAENTIREFKFSILEDGSHYGSGLAGEQVLLQGVVDCAIIGEDGITVIDFKTDRVSEETLPQLLQRYAPQVNTYVRALERIYGKPVKEACLYFFGIGRFVAV